MSLYWHIGQQIVQKQALFGWGKAIVEQLSKDIQTEFVGITGFSARNLWLMKQFYENYSRSSILQPLVAEISWAHHLQIMSKCKNDLEKEFYILMTKKFGWTKNVLIHQIENKTYEQYLLNQTNFHKTVPEKYQNQAILAVKDAYHFDFLSLKDATKPIGIATYTVEPQLPDDLQKWLPSAALLEKHFALMDGLKS